MPPSGAGWLAGKPPSGNTWDGAGTSAGMLGPADWAAAGGGAGGWARAVPTPPIQTRTPTARWGTMAAARFSRLLDIVASIGADGPIDPGLGGLGSRKRTSPEGRYDRHYRQSLPRRLMNSSCCAACMV